MDPGVREMKESLAECAGFLWIGFSGGRQSINFSSSESASSFSFPDSGRKNPRILFGMPVE